VTSDKVTSTSSVTVSPLHPVTPSSGHPVPSPVTGVAVELKDVTVVAGGHTILSEINLTIAPGEQVAIVGASGAGKSSLVGLLLGWQRPAAGQLWVDGAPLTGVRLQALRQVTAWVDPTVQLWNRTLVANLYYGLAEEERSPLDEALRAAQLYPLLAQLPEGLATPLGESGGLVSGGEGQRVRFGRALLRPRVRLAILDEPFRGLDRHQRRQLLANARQQWPNATLLCITHDLAETQAFSRVLVMEGGRIVEDDAPQVLATQLTSRYHALLAADTTIQATIWGAEEWRQLWLEAGQIDRR
jgi:ABC-type multidrug transport system fused ATPase/permease subunit